MQSRKQVICKVDTGSASFNFFSSQQKESERAQLEDERIMYGTGTTVDAWMGGGGGGGGGRRTLHAVGEEEIELLLGFWRMTKRGGEGTEEESADCCCCLAAVACRGTLRWGAGRVFL